MKDTDLARTTRRPSAADPDRGSATNWAIGVLSVILLGLVVFVALKYMGSDDENAGPEPSAVVFVTASADPTPSEEPQPTPKPTPTAGPFDGTWTGSVTGDLHAYTVDVVITDNGSVLTGDVTYTGAASYPEMHCVGEWTQTGRSGNQVDILEVITNGPLCIDEVDITLDLKSNGTIAFAIFYSDTYLPKATLSRDD